MVLAVASLGSTARAFSGQTHAKPAASAQPPASVPNEPAYWFTGSRLIFQHAQMRDGELAVATDDPAFGIMLTKTHSTLSFDPTQKYVVIATADRHSISFTIGDNHFLVGDTDEIAPFAPYVQHGVAFLPLSSLLHVLHVAPVKVLSETVLQPRLIGIDVQSTALATIVTIHSSLPVRFKRVSDDGDDHLTLALLGVSSNLPSDRPVSGVGLTDIATAIGGTPRNPTVVLSFENGSGGSYALAPSQSPNDLVLAFAAGGTSLGGTDVPVSGYATSAREPLTVRPSRINAPPEPPVPPPSTPTAVPADAGESGAMPLPPIPAATNAGPPASPGPMPSGAPLARAGGASVTSLDDAADGLGFAVAVGIAGGPVAYEYHRLADNRWYVDLKNVSLATPERDENVSSTAVASLRVRQLDDDGVPVTRIALSLTSPRIVELKGAANGFTIAVDPLDDLSAVTTGSGSLSAGVVTADSANATIVPPDLAQAGRGSTPWKFGTGDVPNVNGGGRLIVIDPGHGGSDDGAVHNGMREKDLTLDMARRLRDLLLARGWQVKMTRTTDVDVFGVDASAHDELQARCDVANLAGAHLFVSIHVNSFTTSQLNGTTTYYYNGQSLPFAQAVHRRLAAGGLETKDDGILRDNFYVIHHTTMPSILVETAFVSNTSDAQLLASPAWRQKVAAGIAAGIGDYDTSTAANAAFSRNTDGPGGQ